MKGCLRQSITTNLYNSKIEFEKLKLPSMAGERGSERKTERRKERSK